MAQSTEAELVLASASPRRRALLSAVGVPFRAVVSGAPERARPGEAPPQLVQRLALEKAQRVREGQPGARLVLGADTVVALGAESIGKPRDTAHAAQLLGRLLGRTHSVWSGVALLGPGAQAQHFAVESRVSLRAASEAEVRAYLATGESLDKAGAYALQGEGVRFVSALRGSRTNVVGLPLDETLALLGRAGVAEAGLGAQVGARLAAAQARIAAAARRAGRGADSVALLGAAKLQPAPRVAAAALAGLTLAGENRVQEAQRKLPELAQRLAPSGCAPPRWHFIGQLQRNKARWAARLFDCIESVDRLSLARDLDRHAAEAGRRLDILVQVKLGAAAQRGGVNPDELTGLLDGLTALPHLRICGLMGIPPAGATPEQTRAAFARLRGLRDAAGAAVLPELSMGMSADFELAIAEGATIVRLGRALFGGREGAAGAQAA